MVKAYKGKERNGEAIFSRKKPTFLVFKELIISSLELRV